MLGEEPFGVRSGHAGLQLGLSGDRVEVQQPIESTQIQRHHRGELRTDRVQSAHHAGASTERHHRDAVIAAVAQDRTDLLLVLRGRLTAGFEDRIRGVLLTGVAPRQQIQCGFAPA